jgi:hypothetical protein
MQQTRQRSPAVRNVSEVRSVTAGEMTDHTDYDELDMTAPEELKGAQRAPRETGWRRRFVTFGPTGRPRIAIVAALVVGLALGAVGVHKERDSAANRASRAAVSLAAVLVSLGNIDPTDGDVTFLLRLYNAGQEPVEVTTATVVGSAYLVPHDAATGRAAAKPQRWTPLIAVAGRPDCDTLAVGLRALAPPTLRVNARTANRRVRTVDVPLVDPQDLLSRVRDSECRIPAANPGAPRVVATITGPYSTGTKAGRPSLRASLSAELLNGTQVRLVRGGRSRLLDMTVLGTPLTVVQTGTPVSIPIELSVRRCKPADGVVEEDLSPRMRVAYRGEEFTTAVWPQSAAIIQIVALVHRSCD